QGLLPQLLGFELQGGIRCQASASVSWWFVRRRELFGLALISAVHGWTGCGGARRSYASVDNLREEISKGAATVSFRVGEADWQLVLIPPGQFTMGTPLNEP